MFGHIHKLAVVVAEQLQAPPGGADEQVRPPVPVVVGEHRPGDHPDMMEQL
ncbi:MAG TPA: hypothetical protein VE868_12790 [Balneolaceae bacterium]|nr:hypothetical protein [Balneolaceae bacterium]